MIAACNAAVSRGQLMRSLLVMTILSFQMRTAVAFFNPTALLPASRTNTLKLRAYRPLATMTLQNSKYPPGSLEASIVEQLFASIQQDVEQRDRIAGLPQGSQEWLSARQNRLTASNFGAAVGRNRFMSPEKLAQEMLNSTFKGNQATRWGNEKESVALQQYLERKTREFGNEIHVRHSGLHIWAQEPWLAASPDGHVHEGDATGLLEIKCPFRQKQYPNGIPEYYVDQIQGLMAILGYEWADFVVWTPNSMQVERVPFDKTYWEQKLFPGLVNFYQNIFVPAYVDFTLQQEHASTESKAKTVQMAATPAASPPKQSRAPRADSKVSSEPMASSGARTRPMPTPARNSVNVAPPFSHCNTRGAGSAASGERRVPSVHQESTDAAEVQSMACGVDALRSTLAARGLEVELVSRNADSVLIALLTQLKRQRRLPDAWRQLMAEDAEVAVRKARWEVVEHVAGHAGEFCALMGVERAALMAHVQAIAEGTAEIKGAELTAVARAFGVVVRCLLVSGAQVHERVFDGRGGGADGAEVVVCTAGGFFWSTRQAGGGAADGDWRQEWREPEEERGEGGGSARATAGAHEGGAEQLAEHQTQETALTADEERGDTQTEDVEVRSVQGAVLRTSVNGEKGAGLTPAPHQEARAEPGSSEAGLRKEEGAATESEGFTSTYSPLFQKCVIDVEQKLRPTQSNSLEGAFRICNRSLADRKFGNHSTRRDGSSVGDLDKIAQQYQALLIHHSLFSKTPTPAQGAPPAGNVSTPVDSVE